MSSQSEMHVCLVCHTETDVWDGGFTSIDQTLPRFLDMLAAVRDGRGNSPRVAWCLTAPVMEQRAGVFLRLAQNGHEIGIHSHYPGSGPAANHIDHDQGNITDHLDDFHLWLPRLCSLAHDRGFAPPRVQVTGMFAYRSRFTRVLAECGIEIDCSICYGGMHYHPDNDVLLADSRRRTTGKPYRLSADDHCSPGTSPVVELPVSGGFGCYWQPDGGGGFEFFQPVATDVHMNRQLRLFQSRLESLLPEEVDVFHVHFHLYEFLPPDGTCEERLQRAGRLLESMTQDPRVCFSTPTDAVGAWSKAEHRPDQTSDRTR